MHQPIQIGQGKWFLMPVVGWPFAYYAVPPIAVAFGFSALCDRDLLRRRPAARAEGGFTWNA